MAYIEVDGLKEFNRAVRQAADKDLGKRIGQANKRVGEYVISHLKPSPNPQAVGAGRGSKPRPSASKREVIIRVGGAHRASRPRVAQWGKEYVGRVGTPRPPRPFIQGTAEDNFQKFADFWMDAIHDAFDPAFA